MFYKKCITNFLCEKSFNNYDAADKFKKSEIPTPGPVLIYLCITG